MKDNKATLSWEKGQGDDLQYVVEKLGPNGEWQTVLETKDTKCPLQDLSSDREHEYRVSARNEVGSSQPTPSVKVAKQMVPPELPNDAPKIEKMDNKHVTLSWLAGKPEPLTYQIQMKVGKDGKWQPCGESSETKKELDRQNDECEYRILAKNDCGESKPTKSVTVPRRGE
jgi:hypothetical protein